MRIDELSKLDMETKLVPVGHDMTVVIIPSDLNMVILVSKINELVEEANNLKERLGEL